MPETGSPEGGNESGSEFRQKFEALQAENAKLREDAATFVAERFEYVKPEDLSGVSSDELATKAEELQTQRMAERRETLESGLRDLGWSDEQVVAALEGQQAGTPAPASRLEALGSIGGKPVSKEIDRSSMSPRDKIAAAIIAEAKG